MEFWNQYFKYTLTIVSRLLFFIRNNSQALKDQAAKAFVKWLCIGGWNDRETRYGNGGGHLVLVQCSCKQCCPERINVNSVYRI